MSTDWDVTVEDGEDTVSVIGDDSDSVAAFSVGAGLTWTVAEQTTFNVGYRYLKLATVDVETTDLDTLSIDNAGAHVIDAGFNIRF